MENSKKYGFLAIYSPVFALFLDYYFSIANYYLAFLTLVVIYPLLYLFLGKNQSNLPNDARKEVFEDDYYIRVLYAAPPVLFLMLLLEGYIITTQEPTIFQLVGLVLSVGLTMGILCFIIAHELIHKRGKLPRFLGGLLASTAWYGAFKIDHIRGHHLHVGTPKDASSLPIGTSYYQAILTIVSGNIRSAWRLEQTRLKTKNYMCKLCHNEFIGWYLLSFTISALLYWTFGLFFLVLFFIQCILAVSLLEQMNYIQHYGLQRKQLPDGSYEPTNENHSWNSPYQFDDLSIIHLMRHSHHHTKPGYAYPMIEHHPQAPQLPYGIVVMMIIALIPPWWHKLMDERARAVQDMV